MVLSKRQFAKAHPSNPVATGDNAAIEQQLGGSGLKADPDDFSLPPEQEAYWRGRADNMEALEAYKRKPGALPTNVPKPPKARTPRPPTPSQQKRAIMAPMKRMGALARMAKGKKR